MKYTVILLYFSLLLSSNVLAQTESNNKDGDHKLEKITDVKKKNSPLSFLVNLQNNHLWRGLIITDLPMFSVYGALRLDKKGFFNVGFWGSSAFGNEIEVLGNGKEVSKHYKEFDLYVSYARKGFYIGLWDLFNTGPYLRDKKIWNYGDNTGHIIDLKTSYTFNNNAKFSIKLALLLYGDDKDAKGDNRYSTYLELSSYFIHNSNVDLKWLIGSGFPMLGEGHIYGISESFDIVNLGIVASKKVKITTHWSIPLSTSLLWNPSQEWGRLQIAMSLF